MSSPRRHHYLPQFYLRRFSKDGYLWVFDRSQRKLRHERPKNIAVRKHYYSTEDEKGNRDAAMEKFFSIIEAKAKPILDKLDEDIEITLEDRYRLSLLLDIYFAGPLHSKDLLMRQLPALRKLL